MDTNEKTKKGFNYNKILIPAALLVSAVGAYYGYSYYSNLSELNNIKNLNESLFKQNDFISRKYSHALKAIDGLKQQNSLKQENLDMNAHDIEWLKKEIEFKQSRLDHVVSEIQKYRENFTRRFTDFKKWNDIKS